MRHWIQKVAGQKIAPLGLILTDALLPPRCLATGEMVDRQGRLSAQAWSAVNFISDPLCACCGFPFEFGPEEDADLLCGLCLANQPAYDRARAVFSYNDASRAMILAFKNGDRMEGAPIFAAWMARAGAELIADAGLIVPVPLHWKRLFRRRYNQSAVLALALSRRTGVPVMVDALARVRNTPPMKQMSKDARRRNLKNAITVRDERAALLSGRNILLVDDVLTTGATAQACTQALRKAGVSRVDVLSLARVVRPG